MSSEADDYGGVGAEVSDGRAVSAVGRCEYVEAGSVGVCDPMGEWMGEYPSNEERSVGMSVGNK